MRNFLKGLVIRSGGKKIILSILTNCRIKKKLNGINVEHNRVTGISLYTVNTPS